MARNWWRAIPAIAAAAALTLSGCGEGEGDDDDTQAQTAATGDEGQAFPVTIDAANGEVTIEAEPERIVSLAPTTTEMLFAIGAGDQVVAVDSFSNHPPDAPVTDLSAFEPNAEAVAAHEPDLVVLSDDINDIIASLEALQVPVLQTPAAATLDDTYTQIEQLGAATGHTDEAANLATDMQADIDALTAELPDFDEAPTYYHELDQTLFSVTSGTFIGQLYALAGLENIADAAPEGEAPGYPQLSDEYIVSADPDLIFLADTKCCGVNAETVAQRPGWDQLTAVTTGGVVELDDDIASRWGPRVVDFLEIITERVAELEPAGGGG
jgi:iron complex transport system substrate-binding protein